MSEPVEDDSPWSMPDAEAVRRVPMSVRTTPLLRARMDQAARASGRSLAQEVEFRLEQSFRDEENAKQMRGQMDFIKRVVGAAGEGKTGDLLMKLSRGIAEVEAVQGHPWCHPGANLDAYDINLKTVMEGIRRVWFKRSEATMADFIALEYPHLINDPPKMKG